jgi:hypothetical protein
MTSYIIHQRKRFLSPFSPCRQSWVWSHALRTQDKNASNQLTQIDEGDTKRVE